MKRRRRSNGWVFERPGKKGVTWYCGYFQDGKKIREAVGPKKSEAVALLHERIREINDGRWQNPTSPLTFDDLLDLVRAAWRAKKRKATLKTPKGAESALVRHLRADFGQAEAADVTAVRLARYMNDRFDAGAEISTVRNELNVLKRGMRLAYEQEMLAKVPKFPELKPTNIRTGFFELAERDAIMAELPELVKPVIIFMYWTGWRRGEVLSRQWRHVDIEMGIIRLDPGDTKNGEGRDFPYELLPELLAAFDSLRAYTDAVERRTGRIVPHVFHREGEPIRSFRTAWRAACRRSGVGNRIPHDFRRTAVRNLVRAGVSQKVAMELTGHLTASVFDRYNITDDRDRRDAVARLAAAAPDRTVLPIRTAQSGR